MLVQGPLARTVEDVRLALHAMSGTDPRDPFAIPGSPQAQPSSNSSRVALVRHHGVADPSPPVNQALDQAAQILGEAGYQVEEVELPLLTEAYRLWYLLCMEEFRQIMPLVEEVGDAGMKKAAEHYYAVSSEWWGEQPSLADYMNGYARRGTLIRTLATFMEDFPTVLLPVSAEQAFEQDADIASVESMRRVMAAQSSMMAIPVLGFPALSVPTGIMDGLPVGVQLLGRRFDEDHLLDVAQVIEDTKGIFTPIDPR